MKQPKLSHTRRPADLSVEGWQRALRRQFGREQRFRLENLGSERIFSEFRVINPSSGGSYRVAIRGMRPGDNFCSCPDFSTNDLGTCKHIEFTLGRLESKRGARRELARGFRPAYSEIYVRYGAERQVRFLAGSACPASLTKRAGVLFAAPNGALAPAHFSRLEELLAAAQRAGHELRCYEDVLRFIAQARDDARRAQVLEEAYPCGAASPGLDRLLKFRLYSYQAEGALFAVRAGRSLIGDEMGLGKTVQAIAAVELFARHFGVERVLIVCPTSLMHQWQRELARFAGRDGEVVSGSPAVRARSFGQPGSCKITNYEKLARDLELIQRWSPDVVIVDEAQRIKNWNTRAARSLKRIESPYAIVLTGTPLENRLEELVSIVQFVDQQRLGPTWRLRCEHQVLDESGRVVGYRDLDRIGKTLAPILLRRRKAEVLAELPPRVDNTIFVPMTAQQWQEHQANAAVVQQIIERWRRTGFLSDIDQRRLMCALQNMRMSCNSTYLLDGKSDHGLKTEELMTLLDEVFEQPDAKAVVFSQWLGTHELIARRLERRRWGHVLFHGRVPAERRGALVSRFLDDPKCRVFLSTDAGGVGLNLQHAASTVINMDLPWNPAILEQRVGRVHRLGQERGVQVVNMVAQGTIEEGMLSLLSFKRSLFAGVLDGGEREVFLEGSRLKRFMDRVEAVTRDATRADVADAGAAATDVGGSSVTHGAAVGSTGAEAVSAAASRPAASAPATGAPTAAPLVASAEEASPTTTTPASGSPWAPLLSAGLKLLEALAAQASGNGQTEQVDRPQLGFETDPQTGRRYIRLPLPDPGVVQQLAAAVSRLAERLGVSDRA